MRKIVITFIVAIKYYGFGKQPRDYKNGYLGIRAGFSSGLTIKYFYSRNTAFEGLLTTRWLGI